MERILPAIFVFDNMKKSKNFDWMDFFKDKRLILFILYKMMNF